jgi:hypothetical protein
VKASANSRQCILQEALRQVNLLIASDKLAILNSALRRTHVRIFDHLADKNIDKSTNDRNLSEGIKSKPKESKAYDQTLEGKDMDLETLDFVKRKLMKKNESKQKYDNLNFSNNKVNLTQGISKNLWFTV